MTETNPKVVRTKEQIQAMHTSFLINDALDMADAIQDMYEKHRIHTDDAMFEDLGLSRALDSIKETAQRYRQAQEAGWIR